MSTSLTVVAPAKLNLFLHITGQRADGYHELQSLIGFVDLTDEITVTLIEQDERPGAGRFPLTIKGPFADALGTPTEDNVSKNNLAVQAAHALAASLDDGRCDAVGAAIHLTKNIPVAAGLGGGSADAAAVLRALAQLWDVDDHHLATIAPMLGADVPVCLAGRPMLVSGIGEVLAPVPKLPSAGVVLVNPGRAVATPAVFAGFDRGLAVPADDRPIPEGPFNDVRALAEALNATGNDLTTAAQNLAPEITEVLAALKRGQGCRFVRMAGSGATCFGLFDDQSLAHDGAAAIAKAHPDWWCWAGDFDTPVPR